SGDDEEYRRIYTTKIKPRLRSEEGPEAEGTQSRTITVTRKVTAYTVDVTSHDGDLGVLGDFNARVPTPELGVASGAGLHPQAEPQSQIPGGETGKSLSGWKGSGAFPGPPRIEANGQFGELDGRLHAAGPDAQVRLSGGAPCPQGEVAGSSPPPEGGKIKIPALKIPKFGFQAGGEAPAPQVGVGMDVTCSPAPGVPSPSGKAPAPQVDAVKGAATKVSSPPLDVPGVEAADGAKGKIKIPHLTFPKFAAEVPKGAAVPEGALEGEWKGPTFKKVETPQISLSDVSVNLKGPRVEGDLKGLGPRGLQADVKGPKVEVAGPGVGLKGVEMDVDVKGGVDVSVPAVGGELRGPQLGLKGPQVGVEVPGVDIKGPGVSVETAQISVPDVDLSLKGPGVKGNLDVSAPKLEGEL
ncbi:AHNK protein, partial [Oxylabes madagascariensis]|nr:AHNK protein [Oxylabes madagascariensis]